MECEYCGKPIADNEDMVENFNGRRFWYVHAECAEERAVS